MPPELLIKVLREVPFLSQVKFALAYPGIRPCLYKDKSFQNFDLSEFCVIDEDMIALIDQMCPTIKSVTLHGNFLDKWYDQSISDILLPFRFITSLLLSRSPAAESLQFLWQAPIMLKVLELDSLSVPADDFVKYVPVLCNQLTSLAMPNNPQLTKYDLVQILQKFWKLDTLNIVNSEFLTPGTCATISHYCYTLRDTSSQSISICLI